MRGRYKRKHRDTEHLSPGPGENTTSGLRTGVRCFSRNTYVGVRVRMPVKEMLKNIRVAKGVDPQIKDRCGSSVKGEMKRVKSRSKLQKQQHSTNDELSIIIEVLEEDLRTSRTSSPSHTHYFINVPPESPQLALTGTLCDEEDEIVPSPVSSPGSRSSCCRPVRNHEEHDEHEEPVGGEDDWSHSGSEFFWAELQERERLLSSISSSVLLSTDQHGRTALHKAASVGNRLLGFAIAKRMSALCGLDLRDADGMTPLLYAAQNNHPLIVDDLIRLGADVNVKNKSGKTLLHLSAERGFIRVLQAVKCAMMDGVYVDVEATDEAGMSVLQCAVLSMKASVCDSTSSSRVQDQMMETVECLLLMDSYLHTTKGTSVGSF